MTHGTAEALRDLAHTHLPADLAERWIGLLRPGVRLTEASGADTVVGQLGGSPELPEGTSWPVWEGHGPLTFIASVDCGALPADALDVPLPSDGTLSFFYFDGQLDDGTALVLPDEADSAPGARVLYTPASKATCQHAAPPELRPYPRVPLTARVGSTAALPWHPQVQHAFSPNTPLDQRYDHPVCAQEFLNGLWEHENGGHRIGGHASPVQGTVEIEVAHAVLDGDASWGDPRLAAEAREWLLLAQFDSDERAEMLWGDCGTLYWLIRPRDLAERRFDRAMFTWQCC